MAIENERDEDLNDGGLPQAPAGFLVLAGFSGGALDCAGLVKVDLTGLAALAPEDPEPEFVDFNDAERAWECPCHGSRFGIDGQVLQGPAVRPLERKPLPDAT